MNELEKIIINKNMALTLERLNKHFIKNKSISQDDFMDLQIKCWNETKKKFGIK